ncbi:hypothetical protein KHQ88_06245 [Mycoplasmatota bacterium]|nr:hypothetical protein KHQ88_06245 [Mycoplasmatota bacterium]
MEKYDKILELMNHCGESPKVTIMMPTHRKSPDNKKDKILFKNLIQEVKNTLEEKYPPTSYEKLLEKLNVLYEDTMFWSHATKALVVLVCNHGIEIFRLNKPLKTKTKVSNIFDLLSIMTYEEKLGVHYLVDLAKDRFKLYTIRDKDINEMTDHEIKNSFTELYDDFDDEGNLNVGSYGGLQGMYHGHKEKSEELKKDRNKFFRYLDKEFIELNKTTNSHFFFAGTKENINAFKKLSQKDYYHDLAIEQPLSSLNQQSLDEKIEKLTKKLKEEAIDQLRKEINSAYSSHKIIKDYDEVKKAIKEQRIKKLYIKGNVSYNHNYDKILYHAFENKVDSCVIDSDDIKLPNDIFAILW